MKNVLFRPASIETTHFIFADRIADRCNVKLGKGNYGNILAFLFHIIN